MYINSYNYSDHYSNHSNSQITEFNSRTDNANAHISTPSYDGFGEKLDPGIGNFVTVAMGGNIGGSFGFGGWWEFME